MEEDRPTTIVLALCAPSQMKTEKSPTTGNTDSKSNHRRNKEDQIRRGRRIHTAVSVYKINELSCCCSNLLPDEKRRMKLSGCAVISKGIVVVEGRLNSIRRYSKHVPHPVRVVWQGKVARPSFGKFSILHSASDYAVCKFFADHGASHYWDIAVNSDTDS